MKDYGATTPNILDWNNPYNTWIKAGINLVGQHYGGGAIAGGEGGGRGYQPPMYMLWFATTRKYDGKVWTPDERIDRVWAFKMYSRWAANYVRKPEKIGSLEVGKLADITAWIATTSRSPRTRFSDGAHDDGRQQENLNEVHGRNGRGSRRASTSTTPRSIGSGSRSRKKASRSRRRRATDMSEVHKHWKVSLLGRVYSR